MSSPDSSNNNALLAQILQVLTALVDSSNVFRESTESQLAQMEDRSLSVARESQEQTRLLRNALARPAGPASAAELVPWQVLQMERSMLWSYEAGSDGNKPLRLPRPSIIGRALYDLQMAAATYQGSSPAEIYITISVNGRHHLSEVARGRVDRYQAGETRAMSGKINEHLGPRFDALSNRRDGRNYAENIRNRRNLTKRGSRVFANWPHWDARDDDLTGYGPSTSGPAPPASGTGTT